MHIFAPLGHPESRLFASTLALLDSDVLVRQWAFIIIIINIGFIRFIGFIAVLVLVQQWAFIIIIINIAVLVLVQQ